MFSIQNNDGIQHLNNWSSYILAVAQKNTICKYFCIFRRRKRAENVPKIYFRTIYISALGMSIKSAYQFVVPCEVKKGAVSLFAPRGKNGGAVFRISWNTSFSELRKDILAYLGSFQSLNFNNLEYISFGTLSAHSGKFRLFIYGECSKKWNNQNLRKCAENGPNILYS